MTARHVAPENSLQILRPLLAAALLAALLAGCGKGTDAGAQKPGGKGDDKPVPVVTAPVAERAFAQSVTGVATLRARESVVITARSAGRISSLQFNEGATVAAGATLVRLEDDEERAAWNAAKANADLAANRLARFDELLQRGLASQDERDNQAQVLKDAQARAELARVQLDIRTIRAPFAGVLGFRQVSPGALVQPGDAIVSLDAVDTLRADFPVPEALVNVVGNGSSVEGQAAAWPGRMFKGRVTLSGTRVDTATRTVNVQAQIDNRDRALRPGMLLTVVLAAKERKALFVPEAALVPENSRQFVWRIDAQGTASRVEVMPGVRHSGAVEIVAGLLAGDRVVIAGQGNLRDGKQTQETAAENNRAAVAPTANGSTPVTTERAP
jgi:membrane fusion protein (multidrug efflux system)